MMRKILLCTVLLATFGCRDQGAATPGNAPAVDQSAASADAPAPATATAPPAPVVEDPGTYCTGEPGCDALPEGVVLAAPHALLSGRIYTAAGGAKRRQLAFEIMADDMRGALQDFQQSMTGAGFVGEEIVARDDGVLSVRFEKDGYGVANVWANPSIDGKAKSPEAKSILGIDMPSDG